MTSYLSEAALSIKAPSPPSKDEMCLRRDLNRRFDSMLPKKHLLLPRWSSIARYFCPDKLPRILSYRGLIPPKDMSVIIDNTGQQALKTLSSGLVSGLTNPSKPWFKISLKNNFSRSNSVKIWLSEVEMIMRAVMERSNFYESLGKVFEDCSAFGTSAIVIHEDDIDLLRCYVQPIGEFVPALDNRNDVTVLYREMNMSLYALVKEFGIEKLPENLQAQYYNMSAVDDDITVRHAIQKNKDFNPYKKGVKDREYIEYYWLAGYEGTGILREKTYHEKPFCVARWSVTDNDAFGSGLGTDSLGDVKHLQHNQLQKSRGIEKHISPPMLADLSLKNQNATVIPNGITYINNPQSNIGFKPIYQVAPDVSGILEDIQDVRRRIERTFYTDLWMMLDRLEGVQPRNQLELMKREGEKIRQLSPILQRLQRELLSPCIDRIFSILLRAKVLPPVPEELRGMEYQIEYISDVAVAEKATGTGAIEQLIAFAGNTAAMLPGILDKINVDELIDRYADMIGFAPQMLIPTEDAQAARAEKAKMQQQQMALEQTGGMAQAAKVMSETPVGGANNMLNTVMGLGGV